MARRLLVLLALAASATAVLSAALPADDDIHLETSINRQITDTSPYTAAGWFMARIDDRTNTNDGTNKRAVCNPLLGKDVDVYILNYGCETGNTDLSSKTTGSVFLVDTDLNTVSAAAGSRDVSGDGEGTFLASLIGGKTYGLAPASNIYCVRFPRFDGSKESSVLKSFFMLKNLATRFSSSDRRAVVVFALGTRSATPISMYTSLVQNVINAGAIFIIAANDVKNVDGNTISNACNYSPGNAQAALLIGGFGQGDVWYSGSSYNDNSNACIDYVAPAVNIYASSGTGSSVQTRTSNKAAAALVGGVAALVSAYYSNTRFASSSAHTTFSTYLASQDNTPITITSPAGQAYKVAYMRCTTSQASSTPAPVTVAPKTATPTPSATPTINPSYVTSCYNAEQACGFYGKLFSGSSLVEHTPGQGSAPSITLQNCTSGCTGQMYTDSHSNIVLYRVQQRATFLTTDGCLRRGRVYTLWSDSNSHIEVMSFTNTSAWVPLQQLVPATAGSSTSTYFWSDTNTSGGTGTLCANGAASNPDFLASDIFQRLSNVGTNREFFGRCFRVYISRYEPPSGSAVTYSSNNPLVNCFVMYASGTPNLSYGY